MSVWMGRGVGVLLLAWVLTACDLDSTEKTYDSDGAGGTVPGTGGTDPQGPGGTGAQGGAGGEAPVHEELAACDLDEPCPGSVQYEDPGSSTWDEGACLLTAFRDRTPGTYHHSTIVADVGTYTTDYTFLLGGDEKVLVLRVTTSARGDDADRTYLPVWSCTLRSSDELDDCVAAGTDVSPTTGGGPVICDETTHWFEACETAVDPMCPVK